MRPRLHWRVDALPGNVFGIIMCDRVHERFNAFLDPLAETPRYPRIDISQDQVRGNDVAGLLEVPFVEDRSWVGTVIIVI